MQTLSEDNFKVLIKVRPLMPKEKEEIQAYDQSYSKKMKSSHASKSIKLPPAAYAFYTKFYNCNIHEIIKISPQQNTIMIADPEYKNTDRKMKPYTYSAVFDGNDQNQSIFKEELQDHVSTVLDGYNCTILAYGITGSGKTYTIFGANKQQIQMEAEGRGISHQAFDYLLKEKERLWIKEKTKVSFTFSFIEIYNENVRDLLNASDSKYLNVVEDGRGSTTVADITQIPINNIEDVTQCINTGTSKRVFASTVANQYSSRSHAILQLNIEIEKQNSDKSNCKLFIIDLAGSEKLQTLNCSKKMQEGANINKSLLALGNCINTLAENSRKNTVSHIPYRDSKLTRMLKDSLGGNTKTIMIACITPNPFLIEETMTTLNYAMRAQGIQKKILKNSQDLQKQKESLCSRCRKEIREEDEGHSLRSGRKTEKEGEIEQNKQFFEQFYSDIVQNIRENQKIHYFANNNLTNDMEWLKLKNVNEEQGLKLREVFMKMMGSFIKSKRKDRNIEKDCAVNCNNNALEKVDLNTLGNKQNDDFRDGRSSVKSLTNSKTRRRRSHNKFQVPRRSDSNCKNLQFD